ncbi:S8 family serine peptidase [bacterium]|nr:S8 family serine peptidase [bacterium]MBU1984514.1 S8 family serine peptidase [bacterium]
MQRITILILVALLCVGAAAAKDRPLLKSGEPYYEYVAGEVLVKFEDGLKGAEITVAVSRIGANIAARSDLLGYYRVELPVAMTAAEAITYFRSLPSVEWANFNYIAHACWTPNDTYYSYQWHYTRINMPQAWDITRGTASVVVAVCDQGFYFNHEDWTGVQTTNPRDFIDNDNNPAVTHYDSHGQHVAGTIFATTNNNLGVAGIAHLCTLMPVRVLNDSGSGSIDQISNGIQWAATNGAEVLNLSLGFGVTGPPVDPGPPLSTAINNAAAAGIVICAATGNDGMPYVAYPAAYPACIAVGSTALDDAIAPYSNQGTAIDVTAPGGNTDQDLNQDGYIDGVLSTLRAASGDYYGFWQGTSMATPHVAGVAALLLSNGLPAAQVRDALQQTAVDLGPGGWDVTFGHGRINAYAALQWQGGSGSEVVLLEEGFEGTFPPASWTIMAYGTPNPDNWQALAGNQDADGGTTPHGGSNAAFHDDDDTGGMQRDWLITEGMLIPANATAITLRFFERNYYMEGYYEYHGVWMSTDGSQFSEIAEMDADHEDWTEITINITDFTGQAVWFLFYYQGDYATEWFIDDVRVTATVPAGVEEETPTVPRSTALGEPYPNPFNSVATIPFEIAAPGAVELSVYNMLGQRVSTLISAPLTSGAHRVLWDAKDVSSGVYFVKLQSGEFVQSRKLLLLK